MGLILDTSVLIAAERGHLAMEEFILAESPMEPLFITAVTASELLHGVCRATPGRRARREVFVEAVLQQTPCLPFDLPCARRHAELWATLVKSGLGVGAHDMIIAATCLRYDHRLATLNEEEFQRVPGLRLAKVQRYLKG